MAVIASIAVPSAAQAACAPTSTVKAFQAFGDSADYFLAPNGGLESGTVNWTLSGASVVAGNESHFVRAKSDTRSLRIAPGGKAVTSEICIDTTRTGYRFFARQPAGVGSPNLKVSIRYLGPDGVTRDQRVDTLVGGSYRSWAPSRVWPSSIATAIFQRLGFTSESTASVRLVFEVENESGPAWTIDDVYIDPFRAG